MKAVCIVTYVYPPYKNKEGVNMCKYQFKDPEGYNGIAFAPADSKLKVEDNVLVSVRCYKGKWYAKHVEVVD